MKICQKVYFFFIRLAYVVGVSVVVDVDVDVDVVVVKVTRNGTKKLISNLTFKLQC